MVCANTKVGFEAVQTIKLIKINRKMTGRPPRQILPKGVLPTSGAAEIIYVINNSNGGSANTSELTSGGPRLLKAGSLNNSIGKIGSGRPLHIRTDLLPAALSEGSSVVGGDVGGEVVEEEVVVGAEVGFEGHQQPEITFI